MTTKLERQTVALRNAVADLLWSVGCGCCGDWAARKAAEERIAKLLGVPAYADGSGYDFTKYRSKS